MRHPVLLILLASACRASAPPLVPDEVVTPVRMAPPESTVTCAEWVRRAIANPDLEVEHVPEPVAYTPAPIPRRLPAGVIGKDGRAEVRIRVLVDTTGKARMTTFTVVKSTSPWLTDNVRKAVARWTFRPATIAGCAVPRHFNWGAVTGKSR